MFFKSESIMASTEQSIVKAFIDTDSNQDKLPTQNAGNSYPEREQIKHTLVGSQRAVTGTIRVLHQLGYASVGDWSPLLPSTNPGEVMSILTRSISVR